MGHPPRFPSPALTCCNTRTPVFTGRHQGPLHPALPSGGRRHGRLWSASKTSRRTSGQPAPGVGGMGVASPPKGRRTRGRRSGPKTPSLPIKRMEERDLRFHSSPLLSSLPPSSVLEGGGLLMDPKPPTDPLPSPLLCHHHLRQSHLSGPLPSPRPLPASSAGSPSTHREAG